MTLVQATRKTREPTATKTTDCTSDSHIFRIPKGIKKVKRERVESEVRITNYKYTF